AWPSAQIAACWIVVVQRWRPDGDVCATRGRDPKFPRERQVLLTRRVADAHQWAQARRAFVPDDFAEAPDLVVGLDRVGKALTEQAKSYRIQLRQHAGRSELRTQAVPLLERHRAQPGGWLRA